MVESFTMIRHWDVIFLEFLCAIDLKVSKKCWNDPNRKLLFKKPILVLINTKLYMIIKTHENFTQKVKAFNIIFNLYHCWQEFSACNILLWTFVYSISKKAKAKKVATYLYSGPIPQIAIVVPVIKKEAVQHLGLHKVPEFFHIRYLARYSIIETCHRLITMLLLC